MLLTLTLTLTRQWPLAGAELPLHAHVERPLRRGVGQLAGDPIEYNQLAGNPIEYHRNPNSNPNPNPNPNPAPTGW